MARQGFEPFNPARPSPARVHNALLGGKDNFAADRAVADALADPAGGYPGARRLARTSRMFALKAAEWAAGRGVRQYVSCEDGMPGPDIRPVHAVAREQDPSAAVAYVAPDAVAMSHLAALVAVGPGLAVVPCPVTDPAGVLASRELAGIIDLAEPVCVIISGPLSYLPARQARQVTAGFTGPLAPGSVLAVSCCCYQDAGLAGRARRALAPAGPWVNHSPEDIGSFFTAGVSWPDGRPVQVGNVQDWPMVSGWDGEPAAVIGSAGVKL